jgi:glycosyltransferase involved in cell wall biosynthesis
MNDASQALLSVVVIGRNEGERLTRCLQSVRAMADIGGPVELIYVDSASTDDSVARAEAQGARVIAVKPERPSAALGRNAGWRDATGTYVLFLDGDTVLDPAFPSAALAEFADPKVAVVWGHRREIHPDQSLYNRALDLDWIYPPGLSDFCGGDAVMRRDVLVQVNGFDATLIAGEEPELCQRMRAEGFAILHIDRPMTGHDLAMTRWTQYWKRAARAGHAYAEVSERLRNGPFPLWRAESRGNMRRAGVLLGALVAGSAAAVLSQSVWPLVALVAFYAALVVRTAWKARWKSGDRFTLLLYGLHSQFQHIPIFLGQTGYWWNRWRGRQKGLIEYK